MVENSQGLNAIGLSLDGLERTSPLWLTSYIDYRFPTAVTQQDLRDLEGKLLTTAVFTWVKASLVPAPGGHPQEHLLRVEVQERWTTIPVVRGAYGGGVPLKVLGAYDIHTFGRLLTLGAEARQYGTAPPGFVVYGRDPRGASDRYYLGGELWREFRRRQVIAANGDVLGSLSANMTLSRLRLLLPFADADNAKAHAWKFGGDIETTQEAPSTFDRDSLQPATVTVPRSIALNEQRRFAFKVLPTVLFDDVTVDHIEYRGLRAKAKWGPVFTAEKIYSLAEAESDYYYLLPHGWNIATRVVAGQTTFASLQSEYVLGGLDTIRGLPDGAIYGTHGAYTNIELRQVAWKMHYLWLQGVVFADGGGAGLTWSEAREAARASAGIGLRFAVPQVYRLMLRIDYAWSLNGPRTHGITAGLNQFFDPYIPL